MDIEHGRDRAQEILTWSFFVIDEGKRQIKELPRERLVGSQGIGRHGLMRNGHNQERLHAVIDLCRDLHTSSVEPGQGVNGSWRARERHPPFTLC